MIDWILVILFIGRYAISSLDDDQINTYVHEFVTNNSDWNWNLLSRIVLHLIMTRIQSIYSLEVNSGQDSVIQKDSQADTFTIKSDSWDEKKSYWMDIQKLQVPQRIRLFIWKVCHGRLLASSFILK